MQRIILNIILTLLACLVCTDASAKRQRTTRSKLRVQSSTTTSDTTARVNTDTIWCGKSAPGIVISGYDKPLRSTGESLFITNNTTDTIKSIGLLMNYYDNKQRQLHSREVTLNCVIPPGETRNTYFRSWDRQHSFYYHKSALPKKAVGEPYDVKYRVLFYVK